MKRSSTAFAAWSSLMIVALGAIGFWAFWLLERKAMAVGLAAGAGVGLVELESTALMFSRLVSSRSRTVWGVLLGGKSLLIFSAIGILILGLKINAFGFIIGFSEVVLSIIFTAAWLRPGPERAEHGTGTGNAG
jgi:hypothetical protein